MGDLPPQPGESKTYYLARAGQQYGPYSQNELVEYAQQGNVMADDGVWKQGWPLQKRADEMGFLAGRIQVQTVQAEGASQAVASNVTEVHVHNYGPPVVATKPGPAMIKAGASIVCLGFLLLCVGGIGIIFIIMGVGLMIVGACMS